MVELIGWDAELGARSESLARGAIETADGIAREVEALSTEHPQAGDDDFSAVLRRLTADHHEAAGALLQAASAVLDTFSGAVGGIGRDFAELDADATVAAGDLFGAGGHR